MRFKDSPSLNLKLQSQTKNNEMPEANAQANYSFLPWLRRGVISLADAGSILPKEFVSVPVTLHATGQGEAPEIIQRKVQLYGPGHITGIDPRSIVRTIPRSGVHNFESNFLCAIEFYDEDFPWRYTPALGSAGKLAPWIWLVALEKDEYVRRPLTSGALPSIEISGAVMKTAFPDPSTTAAWAHTHLNFTVEGTNLEEAKLAVEAKLDGDPNLGCARLICPRRLRPGAEYTAFLIPAFEKGRLAGLGKDQEEIDATANAQPSWSIASNETTVFPIYFEWDFVTSSTGDFEALAKKLSPLTEEESKALAESKKLMDIRRPGWGLEYNGQTQAIPIESALKPLQQANSVPITESIEETDKSFVQSVQDLLNLGATPLASGTSEALSANPFFEEGNVEDDPIVVPPLYGSFYRDNPLTNDSSNPVRLNAGANKDWYNQLNLNPAWRVASAHGVGVIQSDQERFIDRAWDMLSKSHDAVLLIKRWQYSMEVSQSLFNKRLLPIFQQPPQEDRPDQTFRTVAFVAPMHKSLAANSASFSVSIQKKFMPSAYSGSFTKLTRAGGPLVKRLNTAKATTFFFSSIIFFPPPPDTLFNTLNQTAGFLATLERILIFPPAWKAKDELLKEKGIAGFQPVKHALTSLAPFVQHISIITAPAPVSDVQMYTSIASQINPSSTIPSRLKGILPAATAEALTDPVSVFSTSPEFPEPMYKALAERSSDNMLPGLDQIPINRVALLKTNPSFIESYMVGLNHEISREYLWREVPVALNTTAFRQFWDIRDNPEAINNPESFKDIKLIAGWGPTELGTHQVKGISTEKLVVLIRGELLKKYPNTEVFMQKAEWKDEQQKSRAPTADPVENSSLIRPLFSARMSPDFIFLGFDLDPGEAVGNSDQPGWFFALKERAGDVHFGLDVDPSTADPSWEAIKDEVPEQSCINVDGPKFKLLPRFKGDRSDRIAAMLYQRPFLLYVHASRMVLKK
jgi:hypothetical protein